MICRPCKYQLEKSYQFKKKCEAADTKLRKHVKQIQRLTGEDESDRLEENGEESQKASSSGKSRQVKQLLADLVATKGDGSQGDGDPIEVTEEELVGGYILGMASENMEMEESISEGPSNITLMPAEEKSAKARCTMRGTRIKQEHESDDEADEVQRAIASAERKNVYMMELTSTNTAKGESIQLQPMSESVGKIFVRNLQFPHYPENTFNCIHCLVGANEELKVFQCDKCPKAFTRRIMLKSHQSVHSTQRGFTCQACEKWFPTRSALIRHERTHTGNYHSINPPIFIHGEKRLVENTNF